MANKIVQLTDKDNNKIFPIATVSGAATITMTTTDPGEGSPLGANEYIAVYGETPIILDYSLSEVNTGVKWVDGNLIYKKTINFGTLPNNTTKTVAHGITNLGYVIKIEGTTYNPNNGHYNPIPLSFKGGDTQYNVETYVTSSNIVMISTTDRSRYSAYITLYYTKSS